MQVSFDCWQLSSVQPTLSSQGSPPVAQPVPGAPLAGSQTSEPLQKSVSAHCEWTSWWLQLSLCSLQVSMLQLAVSSQGSPSEIQPFTGSQVSAPVQKRPSSQAMSFGTTTQ